MVNWITGNQKYNIEPVYGNVTVWSSTKCNPEEFIPYFFRSPFFT